MMKTFLTVSALLLAAPAIQAQTVVGLGAGNTLVRFSATAPAAVASSMPIQGLAGGDMLVGVDVRPATGVLYGLAASGRLYTIDPASGVATAGAQLNTAMTGTTFGVDFNPVADRLRVVSDTGQSLRINVGDGATTVDGAISPAGRIIGEVAYTNSVAGAASTALYDIDLASSSLLLQTPPNDGVTSLVGPLGVTLDAGSALGFDIRTVGASNTAYAALRVAGITALYTVDLSTGTATSIAAIGGNPSLRGISVIEANVLPALPATATAIALRNNNTLLRFPAGLPAATPTIVPVLNLQVGDNLIGIDFRPATGALYALTQTSRLYTIDPVSGAATFRSTLNIPVSGTRFAMDFNPVPDRLRVISDSGQNLRVNVDDGVTILDGAINPAGRQIAAAAYTNSFGGTTSTTLFDLDAASASLLVQSPPNNGTTVAVGPLGVAFNTEAGFDIVSVNGNNAGVAALRVGGTTGLYSINLSSGAATLIGPVNGNPALLGLAVSAGEIGAPAVNVPVPLDSRIALLLMALGLAALAAVGLRRSLR